jgi:hypothetical protein
VYLEGVYAFHVTGLYEDDAAGFLGTGVSRRLGPWMGVPVTGRVGLALFSATYEGLPDPSNSTAIQAGLDLRVWGRIAVGGQWTFRASEPEDGLLFASATIHWGGGP